MVLLPKYTVRHTAGYGRLELEDGTVQEWDVTNCAHCPASFHIEPGSGRKRGYCVACQRVTCGGPNCPRYCNHYRDEVERG